MPKSVALSTIQNEPTGRIGVWARKKVIEGEITVFDEPHFHAIRTNETPAAAMANLTAYFDVNDWPPLSPGEAAQVIAHVLQTRGQGGPGNGQGNGQSASGRRP